MGALLLFLVPLALLWVLYVRPQQRRMRQLQDVVKTLEPGDEVITAGGMYGTVTDVTGESLSIEIAPDVVVRVVRGAIRERIGPPADDEDDEDDEDLVELDELEELDEPGAGDHEEGAHAAHGPGSTSGNGTGGGTGDGQTGRDATGRDPTTPSRHEDDA
jgi:preprotein translocase subunit YajC